MGDAPGTRTLPQVQPNVLRCLYMPRPWGAAQGSPRPTPRGRDIPSGFPRLHHSRWAWRGRGCSAWQGWGGLRPHKGRVCGSPGPPGTERLCPQARESGSVLPAPRARGQECARPRLKWCLGRVRLDQWPLCTPGTCWLPGGFQLAGVSLAPGKRRQRGGALRELRKEEREACWSDVAGGARDCCAGYTLHNCSPRRWAPRNGSAHTRWPGMSQNRNQEALAARASVLGGAGGL